MNGSNKNEVKRLSSGTIRRRKSDEAQSPDGSPSSSHGAPLKVLTSGDVPDALVDILDGFLSHQMLGSVSESLITVQVPKAYRLPGLPPGYFFKGGSVRETLRRLVFPRSPKLPFRDYDLVRFPETSDAEDHRLAMKFMADDYEFGHGVEVAESEEVYFLSRDIVANEVLYANGTLSASIRALEDIARSVLRPCEHVTNGNGDVDARTFVKALRFIAEAQAGNVPMTHAGFGRALPASPFDVAVHLDRAFELNREIAEEFVQNVWEARAYFDWRSDPPHIEEAISTLASELRQGIQFFRHLPPELLSRLAGRMG